MSNQRQNPIELIYGVRDDQLVFIPKERALALAHLLNVLFTSKTWGEFKSRVPEKAYHEVIESIKESRPDDEIDGEKWTKPEVDDDFDPDQILCFEGPWPGWPAQEMLEWMPEEVRRKYGQVSSSMLSGDCLVIDPALEREIVEELEAHGFRCVRDVSLLGRAYGEKPLES